ncbi:zinc ABC transporter substrate-binding protein [Ahrensia marina]|uniref:zinc ABC transporter substrate-binding protein n=1 Tax=Ahrensia marina TaxID=1514904 RepID=UPI0035D042C9
MSRLSLSVAAVLLSSTTLASADVPNVAADIAPIHSLVARVMDGVGTPNLVIPAGASPHSYNLRPSEASALQEADLVFWMGEDLSPWLKDTVETLASGAVVTELLEVDGIELLDFRENALFEAHSHGDHEHGHGEEHAHDDHDHDHGEEHAHDDHDHDHGEEHAHDDHDHDHGEEHAHDDHDHDHGEEHAHDDHDHDHGEEHAHDDHDHDHGEEHAHDDHDHDGHAHGEHDPHAWLSPQNAATWLNVIAAQLSATDPDNAGAYFANAAAGIEELEALNAEVSDMLDPVRGGSFIVFHDAYQYFEVAYDFPASGAISLGDAADPSPARIAEIQARIRDESVDCVLSEPQYNPGLVATVLDGTDATTGVIDPLGSAFEPGAGLYPKVIRGIARTLSECL